MELKDLLSSIKVSDEDKQQIELFASTLQLNHKTELETLNTELTEVKTNFETTEEKRTKLLETNSNLIMALNEKGFTKATTEQDKQTENVPTIEELLK